MREVDEQIKIRSVLAIAACAYEIYNETLMSDYDYDQLSLKINCSISTGREDLDKFFREEFDPSTGIWIYSHPDLERIKQITEMKLNAKNSPT